MKSTMARWLLVVTILPLASSTVFPNPSEVFSHNSVLDGNDNYYLFWKYDNTSITFEVHGRTKGFIGFGISPNGGMVNADVVVGWVRDGKAFLQDRHTKGKFEPIIDSKQDWILISGHEDAAFTVLKFKRDLDTCDKENDIAITDGTTRVIFAWSSFEPTFGSNIIYHGSNRGTKSVLLLQPTIDVPKLPVKDIYTYDLLMPRMNVPSERTTYWCTAFNFPKFDRKYHLVKYEPVITPGNEGIVHHILVYGCYHKIDLGHHGRSADCGANNAMPPELMKCTTVILAWAIGGTAYNYPAHVGWPMGDGGDPTFLRMEVHYDNPMGRTDVMDNSGLRVYYTPKLRQYDSGVLEVGVLVSPQQMIPPQFDNMISRGYCYKDCTQKAIPKEGIHFFTSLPHAHLLGKGVSTRLVRNGVEVATLGEDMSYDFDFQEYRHLPEEVTVYPGDEFITECHYKSTGKRTITHGGLGTTEEMCLNFMLYYPRMDFSRCDSLPSYQVLKGAGVPWKTKNPGNSFKNIYEFVYATNWGEKDNRNYFQSLVDNSLNWMSCEKRNMDQYLDIGKQWKPIEVKKRLTKASTCPKQ